jgi:uncharacterized protein YuzE
MLTCLSDTLGHVLKNATLTGGLRSNSMRIKYFADTDTALLTFTEARVAETLGVSDDVYLDLDDAGRLVSMTIEHAKASAGFREVELEGVC